MNSGEDSSPPSSCKIPNKVAVLSVVSEIKHEERQKDMPSLYTHSLRPVDYGTKWKWKHLFLCFAIQKTNFSSTLVRQYLWIYLHNKNQLKFQEKSELHEKSLHSMTQNFRKVSSNTKKRTLCGNLVLLPKRIFSTTPTRTYVPLLPSSASVCISWYDYVLNINSDYLTR